VERVVGWDDYDGRRHTSTGGRPRSQGGFTLRPTGMVVFATLDRVTDRRDTGARRPGLHLLDGPVLRNGAPRAVPVTRRKVHGSTDDWRRLAARGAAWLLGR
jgi:hypothetical protein